MLWPRQVVMKVSGIRHFSAPVVFSFITFLQFYRFRPQNNSDIHKQNYTIIFFATDVCHSESYY